MFVFPHNRHVMRFISSAALVGLAFALTACGIKGPLYMPVPKPAPTSSAPVAVQPDINKAPQTSVPSPTP